MKSKTLILIVTFAMLFMSVAAGAEVVYCSTMATNVKTVPTILPKTKTPIPAVTDTNSQEVIRGKFTDIQVFLNYENTGADLLYFNVRADPLRLYQIQYSTDDMLSWHPIADLFGGVNNWMQPGISGTFGSYYLMVLPPRCCYRLLSTAQ